MKLFIDFLPIVLFFIAYKSADLYVATGVLIIATLAQVAWTAIRHRRVEKMPLFTATLVLILGGATLILHDPIFLKWKPTVVNAVFAIVFIGSVFFGEKTLLERMLGTQWELPKAIWVKLTLGWSVFFVMVGLLNLYVAFTFDENTWVNFKLFGILGLTFLFVMAQAAYVSRYLKDDTDDDVPTAKEP